MSKHYMSKYPQSYLKFSRATPSPQIPALSFLHQSDLLRTSIISNLHRIRVCWLSNGTDSNLNFELICELNFKGRHYRFVQNGVTICDPNSCLTTYCVQFLHLFFLHNQSPSFSYLLHPILVSPIDFPWPRLCHYRLPFIFLQTLLAFYYIKF